MTEINLGFGLADIKVGGVDIGSQGDSAEFSAEPVYLDIESYENGLYDRYLEKWNVKLKVVMEEESYEKLQMALPVLEQVEVGNPLELVGLKDGGAHQRVRSKAKEVSVHPRGNGTDASYDITIYMAYPTGVFKRTYGKELTKYEIEFTAFPKTGQSKNSGNYFLIGEDPLGNI
jgi:hypothetical protein